MKYCKKGTIVDMYMTRLIVPASVIFLLAGCGVVPVCDTGSVEISVEKPGWLSLSSVANKGDLPENFDFSSTEFASAITGVWSDSENAMTLTLTPFDPAEVKYSVAKEGASCTTESTMEIIGELDDSIDTFTLSGTFSSSKSLNGANLSIVDETRSCWFEYVIHDDGTIVFNGSCLTEDPDGGDAVDLELALVKSG